MSKLTHINYLGQGNGLPPKISRFRKGTIESTEDPLFLTFYLDFSPTVANQFMKGDPFTFNSLLMDMDDIKLEYDITNIPRKLEISAIEYLSRTENSLPSANPGGFAQNLRSFQMLLKNTYEAAPWYFQSITGINDLWKLSTSPIDVNKKVTLTINTLESVDMRIIQMANFYRNAVYNKTTRSYRVPENMRQFAFDLYLFEIRNLKEYSLFSKSPSSFTNGMHYVKFKCKMCEFDFNDTLAGGNTPVDIKAFTEEKPFSTSFKINVGLAIEDSEFAEASDITLDPASIDLGIFSGAVTSLGNQARRQITNLTRIPARVIGAITNEIQSTVTNVVLGNAYSGQRRDIVNIDGAVNEIGRVFEGPAGRISPRGPAPTNRNELGRRSGG
jgi:hypothetical protein